VSDLEPPTLAGRHVRLEPLAQTHHPALCAIGLDPELWEMIPYRVTTPAEMTAYIQTALDHQAAGSALPFATVHVSSDAPSGQVIGSTRFMNIDLANRRLEIGATWIAGPWRRTAVNTEAKYLMLRHAFETLGCIRVELKTDALNQRSRIAIRRIGATEEGTLRQHMITWSGRLRDSVYFSILDSEWPRVKLDLAQKLSMAPLGPDMLLPDPHK
jgi:RimJ/RimL family protein N-acetyltransferase